MRRRSELSLALIALSLAACGPRQERVDAPPAKLTAEDEVLAVAKVWQALEEEHGAGGPKHKVASFDMKQRTTLTLQPGQRVAEEKIEIKERFEMKSGAVYECRARGLSRVQIRFGRKNGEPALEVRRPSSVMTRTCVPSDFPDREIQLGGSGSRFLMRDEQLVGFAPPSEKRVFLPQL
jgi:hypothetical protein